MILHRFKNPIEAIVLYRPSKINKSPYLADIIIKNKKYMAHTPSLGLSGLIIPKSKVIVEKNENKKNVSKFKIVTVKIKEYETNNKFIYVGANPVLVNRLFKICVEKNLIKFPKYKRIKSEINFFGSRIDFEILDEKGIRHIIECKYVPTVDYHPDHIPVNRKVAIGDKNKYKRAAIFPDGWQYKKGSIVSERAVKHLKSLIRGSKEKKVKCYNYYFCLRKDVSYFRPNHEKDKIYTKLFKKAIKNGVIIKAFKLKYSKKNIKFISEIPIKF